MNSNASSTIVDGSRVLGRSGQCGLFMPPAGISASAALTAPSASPYLRTAVVCQTALWPHLSLPEHSPRAHAPGAPCTVIECRPTDGVRSSD